MAISQLHHVPRSVLIVFGSGCGYEIGGVATYHHWLAVHIHYGVPGACHIQVSQALCLDFYHGALHRTAATVLGSKWQQYREA